MKLFIILTFIFANPLLHAKNKKINRKVASVEVNAESTISALEKMDFVSTSKNMVDQVTGNNDYSCSDKIAKSEIKSIKQSTAPSPYPQFKFIAKRICFQQDGAGVAEVDYTGMVRKYEDHLVVYELSLKITEDSAD